MPNFLGITLTLKCYFARATIETKYSRMDQVKFMEESLGRQNLKGYDLLKRYDLSSTNFTWSILEYFVSIRKPSKIILKFDLRFLSFTFFVAGDAFGAGIVHHLSREDLREMDLHQMENHAKDEPIPIEETPPRYEGLTVM